MSVDVPRLLDHIDVCQHRRMSKSSPAEVCCTPLHAEPLSSADAERVAGVLKAAADPVRLRLLSIVLSHEGAEACVCDLLPYFELSQPTISHHLKVLHEAGLLDREKRGTWVFYAARPSAMAALADLFTPARRSAVPA